MKYNPFKYWYHRTRYYMKHPIVWLVELFVISVFTIVLLFEGALSASQILTFILCLYIVWKMFHGFLRFIVSLIVCLAATHHAGFKQEYYDCINGR
ncbi:hypothetical protein SIPHO063v1_p0054 [Vibrio phage PS10B.1]|nr:hypothetical protein SIPHO063v1_p0054 [Vibrio phage PS10B.1]